MPMDRFLVAPYDKSSGLRTDLKPWIIPDEAFARLANAYVFRGRLRKRFGSRWLGASQLLTRLRVKVGTTDGSGDLSVNLSTVTGCPASAFAVGQMFSVGTQMYTLDDPNSAAMIFTGTSLPSTFYIATGGGHTAGDLDIDSSDFPSTDVYWYPCKPVMGLLTYQQPAFSNEITIAFDTLFAYQYTTGWSRLNTETTSGAALWSGNDSQFFWSASYGGANAFDPVFFVTNFKETEANFMRVYNGSSWNNFRPQITVTPNYVDSALIIVPFKNRLLLFNTWENESGTLRHYPFRMRYCAVGSALAANAWRQDIAGQGSGIDCPTNESVVTVEFIRDRLIVFMESSTWEIAYTGNQIFPFAWQQINTELGAESTFSIVPFDKVAIGVGNVGIHSCNATSVDRIDSSIPDEVFNIHNGDGGIERVYGIRDYFVEMIYWTFPDETASSDFPFPKRVLVYNYKTGTWSFNDDSITAFGYFQPQTSVTWDSNTVTWDSNIGWGSGEISAQFRNVVGGNQQGWTFIVDPDINENAPALQITRISVAAGNIITITSSDNNLSPDSFVYIESIQADGNLELLNNKIFKVTSIDLMDPDVFTIAYDDQESSVIAGEYFGGGTIARSSKIDILTKEYSFYISEGRNVYVSKVDFQVDRTDYGKINVDYYVSTNDQSMIADSQLTSTIMGNNVLETSAYATIPWEQDASRLIHSIYFQGDGEFIQIQLSMSDEQMMEVIAIDNGDGTFSYTGPTFEDFQLHSMTIYAQPTSYRNQ